MSMKVSILGIQVDSISKNELLQQIENWLQGFHSHTIVTINPEMVVQAQKDVYFKEVLNCADMAVADGFGIMLAAKWKGMQVPERITGVDLVYDIAALCKKNQKSIFLLGAREKVAERAAKKLQEKFPSISIVGAESGGKVLEKQGGPPGFGEARGVEVDINTNRALIERIKGARPDVLFVAFGHGKQEKWLNEFLKELPSVKVVIGVGGAFDYISGNVWRAPKALRAVGLEWLWRLLVEPWRMGRIYRATVVFLWKVIR